MVTKNKDVSSFLWNVWEKIVLKRWVGFCRHKCTKLLLWLHDDWDRPDWRFQCEWRHLVNETTVTHTYWLKMSESRQRNRVRAASRTKYLEKKKIIIKNYNFLTIFNSKYFTFPQFRQWWRLLTTVKIALHDIHMGASLSGTQGGGVSISLDNPSPIMPLNTNGEGVFSITTTGLFSPGITSAILIHLLNIKWSTE